MNSVIEKEKKLNLALTKLKNFNFKKLDKNKDIENLINDYNSLSKKLDELQNQEKAEQKRQIEFSEKIDELNQETDILLDEIDKWQT